MFVLALVGLILLAAALWRLSPAPSELEVRREGVYFPTVSGSNLNRRELLFPRDFAGELNILFVPFRQRQQAVVNTWVPFAQETEAAYPGTIYYELPAIERMPALSRLVVNEGMRAGIPDETARRRTVTLYIDLETFMAATDIPDRDAVHILLVNRDGDILWRDTGPYNEAKGASLLRAIEANR